MLSRRLMTAVSRGAQLVSAASGGGVFSASLTITKPSGLRSGDVLVAIMAVGGTAGATTWTGATGWTERVDQGAEPSLRVATLTAGGSEPASYTFTASRSATNLFGIILCVRNAQWDVIGSIATQYGAGALAIGGVTSAGGVLIAAVASYAGTPPTHSTPTGMLLAATEAGFFQGGISAFFQDVQVGATGTRTSTVGGAAADTGGVLIGLKAA